MCENRPLFDETVELADNAMLKDYHVLFEEWDFEKNNSLNIDVYKITKGSQRITWWICSKCKSGYEARTASRTKQGQGCPYCAGKKINHTNNLTYTHPELLKTWNYNKNLILPDQVSKGLNSKVWWTCEKCKSDYECSVANRVIGKACSYCHGRKVNDTNSFASLKPELAVDWHPFKNNGFTAHDFTSNSKTKVWWKCSKCFNDYECSIANRFKGKACPYCSNQKILAGYNDMWTTHEELAMLLMNPEDGHSLPGGSNKKVEWKCSICNKSAGNRSISKVLERGVKCKECTNTMSVGERLVNNLLVLMQINFEHEKSFNWSGMKRYDFFLEDYNTIIEVHGLQHYKGVGFSRLGGRTVNEEKENDLIKETLAQNNEIENYIVINASDGKYEFIASSIIDSGLLTIIDLNEEIDWSYLISISKKHIILNPREYKEVL